MSYAPPQPHGHVPPPKKSSTTTIVLVVVGVLGLLGLCCVGGVALLLPAVQVARDAAQRVQTQNDLRELGLAYWNYRDQTGKSPSSWDDLTSAGLIGSETVAKLQAQNVTVLWSLDFDAVSRGPLPLSEFVLAHPANASGPSVAVLMGDGSVLNIPPDELQRKVQTQMTFPGPPPAA